MNEKCYRKIKVLLKAIHMERVIIEGRTSVIKSQLIDGRLRSLQKAIKVTCNITDVNENLGRFHEVHGSTISCPI